MTTALASALDIPDEEPRVRRGLRLAALGCTAWLAVGVVISRALALGGLVSSHLVVGGLLAVPAIIVAWALAGPGQRRLLAAVLAMATGLVLMPLASHGATPSPAKLTQIADAIGMPGTTVRDRTLGNGRCRPACSELRRDAVADGSAYAKVRAQVIGALQHHGFTVRLYAHAAGAPQRIDATSKRVLVSLELRRTTELRTTIVAVFLAQGPAPSHSVGDTVKKP